MSNALISKNKTEKNRNAVHYWICSGIPQSYLWCDSGVEHVQNNTQCHRGLSHRDWSDLTKCFELRTLCNAKATTSCLVIKHRKIINSWVEWCSLVWSGDTVITTQLIIFQYQLVLRCFILIIPKPFASYYYFLLLMNKMS